MYEIYAIRDVRTGFCSPVVLLNRLSAVHQFREFVQNLPEVPSGSLLPSDFGLFYLGSYDSNSGLISAVTPEFVCSGDGILSQRGDVNESV